MCKVKAQLFTAWLAHGRATRPPITRSQRTERFRHGGFHGCKSWVLTPRAPLCRQITRGLIVTWGHEDPQLAVGSLLKHRLSPDAKPCDPMPPQMRPKDGAGLLRTTISHFSSPKAKFERERRPRQKSASGVLTRVSGPISGIGSADPDFWRASQERHANGPPKYVIIRICLDGMTGDPARTSVLLKESRVELLTRVAVLKTRAVCLFSGVCLQNRNGCGTPE